MKNSEIDKDVEQEIDQSRRKLLKKTYTAPVVIALGSMAFSADAGASWWGHRHTFGCGHSNRRRNESSSLRNSRCRRCGFSVCQCRRH